MKRSMILVVAISFVVPRQATGVPTILNGDFEGPFIQQGDDLVPEHWVLSESPLEPGEPKSIYSVQLVGAGWDFNGAADNIRFAEGPTSLGQTTWGAIKSLYR